MKILLLHGTSKISGGEMVSLEIAKSIKNHDFLFFLPEKPANNIDYFKNYPIFYPDKSGILRTIRQLRLILRKEKIDIIHAHGTRAVWIAKLGLIANFNRPKLIYTIHGIHFLRKKGALFLTIAEIISNLIVDALICVGRDDYKLAKRLKLIKKKKLFLIENGIDIAAYDLKYDTSETKKKLTIGDQKIITTVCRLHRQKDARTLIKALAEFKTKNFILLIVGDGPEKKDLEKLAESLEIGGIIKFLGQRKDIPEILAITDIFILSTNWEGLPLVILEAMASKKAVIGANVHGVRELINSGENGFLFENGNINDLKNKIQILLNDLELRKKMGEKGYETVRSDYSKEKMILKYKKLYNNIK